MIAIGMRRRLVPLIARELQISIDEHVLLWQKYIIEHDIVVGFVETARQRIVEGIVSAQRERPAWNELDARRVDRDGEAIGVVLVSWLQWVNAAQMNPVRKSAASRNLLCTGDDDAIVALFDYARAEGRIALFVRRFAAVDLRRHDRVAEIEVVVTNELVERDDVVGEALPANRKNAGNRRVAGEKRSHMIRGAPH